MKLKPYKIIFTFLIFLGLFLSFGNIGSAGKSCNPNVANNCGPNARCRLNFDSDYECVEISTETKANTPNKTVNINFTPQIPFGDTITSDDIRAGSGIAKYITNVYKYAVSVVGILAAIVLMWGGVRWLTAGGNGDAVSDAKKWIEGALSGLILIMTSYMILYFVNPDLTNFKLIKITPIEVSEKAVTERPLIVGDTCNQYLNTNNVINFNTGRTRPVSPSCRQYDSAFSSAARSSGIDSKLLKAIAMTESSCNQSATSAVGACGIMQLLPATAGKSCEYLNTHPAESIQIAAQHLSQHKSLPPNDLVAGYNSGYGETGTNGSLAALAPSNDCPGKKAYECCIKPGGLAETQGHVTKTMEYFNGLQINN